MYCGEITKVWHETARHVIPINKTPQRRRPLDARQRKAAAESAMIATSELPSRPMRGAASGAGSNQAGEGALHAYIISCIASSQNWSMASWA